eukprot:7540402-Pyramimonas_sp.AAC.1
MAPEGCKAGQEAPVTAQEDPQERPEGQNRPIPCRKPMKKTIRAIGIGGYRAVGLQSYRAIAL